jgi:hypothetical protein
MAYRSLRAYRRNFYKTNPAESGPARRDRAEGTTAVLLGRSLLRAKTPSSPKPNAGVTAIGIDEFDAGFQVAGGTAARRQLAARNMWDTPCAVRLALLLSGLF